MDLAGHEKTLEYLTISYNQVNPIRQAQKGICPQYHGIAVGLRTVSWGLDQACVN